LAHVGLTRARKRAKIYFVSHRRVRGSWNATVPSRFIDELPEPHVAVEESKGAFGGFTGYGNVGGSRFDEVETFGSTYATPGWQRAKGRGGFGSGGGGGSGGSTGGAGNGVGFRDTALSWNGRGARGRSPVTIEGELVAKSTGAVSPYGV